MIPKWIWYAAFTLAGMLLGTALELTLMMGDSWDSLIIPSLGLIFVTAAAVFEEWLAKR